MEHQEVAGPGKVSCAVNAGKTREWVQGMGARYLKTPTASRPLNAFDLRTDGNTEKGMRLFFE